MNKYIAKRTLSKYIFLNEKNVKNHKINKEHGKYIRIQTIIALSFKECFLKAVV